MMHQLLYGAILSRALWIIPLANFSQMQHGSMRPRISSLAFPRSATQKLVKGPTPTYAGCSLQTQPKGKKGKL